jgi:hypothetical protein
MRASLFLVVSVFTLLATLCILIKSANAAPIAGVEPFQRPQDAPVIEWVKHDQGWYQHALTGIQPPYPISLYFLDNQGYWYTPFNRPGMTGRYDLRGWHQPPP